MARLQYPNDSLNFSQNNVFVKNAMKIEDLESFDAKDHILSRESLNELQSINDDSMIYFSNAP